MVWAGTLATQQGSKLRPIQSHLWLNFCHLWLKFANLPLNFRVWSQNCDWIFLNFEPCTSLINEAQNNAAYFNFHFKSKLMIEQMYVLLFSEDKTNHPMKNDLQSVENYSKWWRLIFTSRMHVMIKIQYEWICCCSYCGKIITKNKSCLLKSHKWHTAWYQNV